MEIIAKSLAPALGLSAEKVEQWLEVLVYRAAEELLLSGSVHLSGIGVLRKVHIPSRPVEEHGHTKLLPPRAALELLPEQEDSAGFLYDVAIDDLGLEEDLAERFVAGVATAVQKTLEFKSRVELGQLGTLHKTEQGVTIEPSEWILDLLNKPYQMLDALPLSAPKAPSQPNMAATASVADATPVTESQPRIHSTPTEPPQPTLTSPESSPAISHVTLDPTEFGLDAPNQAAENTPQIFLQQSGLLADLEKKHRRNKDKKAPFQPPIPTSPEEVEALLQPLQSSSSHDTLATPSEHSVVEAVSAAANTALTEEKLAAAPAVIRTPREELSRGAILTLIGVAVAVVAVVVMFFFYARSTRTFPTSSPAAQNSAPSLSKPSEAAHRESKASPSSTLREPKTPATTGNSLDSDGTHSAGKPSARTPDKPPVSQATPTSITAPKASSSASTLPPELSTPVSEAKGGWTIVVASRPTEQEAKQVAATFAEKGFSVSIKPRTVNGEIRYRVRVGQFAQQSDALKAIRDYASQLPKGAFLNKIQ
ncbi:MAG: SPOR domain-containing protein [Chloroherpetonaceae bacterium]|nr:SPOR domain-containing protein [Chloroherpetonaceae bacterium]